MKDPKDLNVAILTAFSDAHSAYSLVTVVANQCAMLDRLGIKFRLFVNTNFDYSHLGQLKDYESSMSSSMPTDVLSEDKINDQLEDQLEEWAEEELSEYNVIITHDLMFQSWFVTHNSALRRVMKQSKARWIHWQHSLPGLKETKFPALLRTSKAPNSTYVCLAETEALRMAELLGLDRSGVRVCYNAMDFASYYGLDSTITDKLEKRGILKADLIQFFPFSMPRWKDKGVHKVLRIFSEFKKLGFSVGLILANAHAQNSKKAIKELESLSSAYDLEDEVFLFSREGLEGVERDQVRALFSLSDMFIFPSISDTCSLVLLEASAACNLIVLNSDLPSMVEFCEAGLPRHSFSSVRQKTEYQDEDAWLGQVAKSLLPAIRDNTALTQRKRIRQKHSYSWICTNQFLPLLIED